MKGILRWFAEDFSPAHVVAGIVLFGLAAGLLHAAATILGD